MSRKPKHILWITLIVTGLFSITAGAVSHRLSLVRDAKVEAKSPVTSQPVQATPASRESDRERVEVETITLRTTGFEPSEIVRPKGSFVLVVNNQSGINELDLKLDSDKGRVKNDRLPKGKKRWKTILDLPPGDYVLTDSSDPTRVAHITITTK